MNLTGIEWVVNPDGSPGYTTNPITGCLNHHNGLCKGGGFPCYAYKLAHGRLKRIYQANHNVAKSDIPAGDYPRFDPFYPRFWEERLDEIWALARDKHTKARGIFPCDMSDLFGIGIPEEWTNDVLEAIKHASPHRFYLLTKQGQNLIKWSPFPENCFVGVTATNEKMLATAIDSLRSIAATVRFISLEPLLSWNTPFHYLVWESLWRAHINWLIIGACTGNLEDIKQALYAHKDTDGLMPTPWGKKWTLQPPINWLREIVEAADKAGIPVFLKDNLKPLIDKNEMRQYETLWQQKAPGVLEFPLRIRQEMPK
jgi:protein gp37